jgi:twitching motility two-component system response regulator PilH
MARILIADDSPTEVYVLQKILEKHGHQIIVAEDGEQAVSVTCKELPDLVLMDVVMPLLNGFQATRKLSKQPETQAIPVVIVSSKNQETDKLWGIRQGAKGYLGKPVSEEELVSTMKSLLADLYPQPEH